MNWIKTDKHVYGAIFREHKDNLTVFSSFSNPYPSELQYDPEMLTEWGFKNANRPLIKSVIKWKNRKRETTEMAEFFIYCAKESEG